mgnify:CR=1 FL=1
MKAKPIMTFREGAIGLSIWQREGKAGTYFDFTLSRCFQATEGTFSYSNSFHESNADAVTKVVNQAALWIQQHRLAAQLATTVHESELLEDSQEAYG